MAKARCLLFVLLARDKPLALILRRGPSAWYHLIRWDTSQDSFEHGAWFKGRLYEERCDLSPDGELFLAFALKGNWKSTYKGTWTAVSRAPWLHALTLWPQGHTWGGGGVFLEDRKIVLANGADQETHPDHPLVGLEVVPFPEGGVGAAVGDFPPPSAPEFDHGVWSGRDHAGHVIRAREGKLFRTTDGVEREIADWSELTPDPRPCPAWATKPLPPVVGKATKRRRKKK